MKQLKRCFPKRVEKVVLMLGTGLFLSYGLTSCEDFLTVLPTNKITEDQFWQDKSDVENARAGAYKQMISANVTNRILYWGELRSDNMSLNDQSKTDLQYLLNGILMPTNSMFSWDAFYTGINYCNKVIENGQVMVDESRDPSFKQSDFQPIKAEMLALRALNYFYLIRAFRDVPYVTKGVSTDAEARALQIPVSSAEAILGDLCAQLDSAKTYAQVNFGSTAENHGRFTRLSIRALLADMYLWRGCLLRNYEKKLDASNHLRAVNLTDVKVTSGDSLSYVTADGTAINKAYCDALSNACFRKAIEECSYIIAEMTADFKKKKEDNPGNYSNYDLTSLNPYPLRHLYFRGKDYNSVVDIIYAYNWSNRNSDESLLELQYNGSDNVCETYKTYLTSYASGILKPVDMVAASSLYSSASSETPGKGFSKTDIRLLETLLYSPLLISSGTIPFVKNVSSLVTIDDLGDMTEGGSYSYRTSASSTANWPVYRLTDVMLIQAEAIARLADATQLKTGYKLVNAIYERNNPGYVSATDATAPVLLLDTASVNATTLLTTVYNERRREFAAEGKRWFELVRQAEFGDYYSSNPTRIMESMSTYISSTEAVQNRMRSYWSFYCPFTEGLMKVMGVSAGGYLVQNPVWSKYANK